MGAPARLPTREGVTTKKGEHGSPRTLAGDIRMCAGKQELLDRAVLALNYGAKYGRNGVKCGRSAASSSSSC